MANQKEQDYRLQMLNSFLMTPHGALDRLKNLHQEMAKNDPIFYAHLASWYNKNGEVRDHKELFSAHLMTGDVAFRDTGCALLEVLPPYQVAKIMDYCKKTLNKFPKIARKTVESYLKTREKDSAWFDSSVVRGKKAIKHLYASVRVKPSERAQKILFENNPPQDSTLYSLKLLAKETEPTKQAKIIFDHKIPYPIAIGAVKTVSPSLLVALVNNMSSQELINNMSSLQKRGAYEIEGLKKIIEEKLVDAQKDKRVSTLKARVAVKQANLSADLTENLEKVATVKAQSKGTINKPLAIFIDKSGSMDIAIKIGKEVATLCSGISTSDLFVYAFDTMGFPVTASGKKDMADWEKAFRGICAGGGTSIGIALELMRRKKERVEHIIIITDECENSSPYFHDAYKAYCECLYTYPTVTVVKVGNATEGACWGDTLLSSSLKAHAIDHMIFHFTGDYYSLPNIIPMINQSSKLDLLLEIMETPLLARKKTKKALKEAEELVA